MLLRNFLLLMLAIVLARIILRVVGRMVLARQGRGASGGRVPPQGVHMVRDPICGTYVVPDRALALSDGSRQVFFCSTNCRNKYRPRHSAKGRTA